MDTGGLQQTRQVFRGIVGERVSDGQDPEGVGLLRQRMIGIGRLRSCRPEEHEKG